MSDQQAVAENEAPPQLDDGIRLTQNERAYVEQMVSNLSLTRANFLSKLFDARRDIDDECGYPKTITNQMYKTLYDREGIATRIVSLFPSESWAVDPLIYETEDPKETEFEKAFKELDKRLQVLGKLEKIDEISGIGRFGVLLLGIDDGKSLDKPVDGVSASGEVEDKAKATVQHKLLYVRVFDESVVSIKKTEQDTRNPRFGKPLLYVLKYEDTKIERDDTGGTTQTVATGRELTVHWSRIIHVADNRKTSELYGVPRMQTVYNRLYDIRKIAGGSGEMFWKGGFPGFALEMDPNAKALSTTTFKDLRDEVIAYADGLQRYMMFQGVKVNGLAPQVADPTNHIDSQLQLIAITIGVPKRIFMGSEQAQLASGQDTKRWNQRVARRQNKYITPEIIRPFIDRMIMFGALPKPAQYEVFWKDLNALSEKDAAEVLKVRTEAYAKYVQGTVDALIPPEEYLTMIAGMDAEEVKTIMDAALKREKELEEQEPEEEEDEERGRAGAGGGAAPAAAE